MHCRHGEIQSPVNDTNSRVSKLGSHEFYVIDDINTEIGMKAWIE